MSYFGTIDDNAAVRRLTVDAEREPAQRSVQSTANISCGMNGILRQLGFRRSSFGVCRHRRRLSLCFFAAKSAYLIRGSLIYREILAVAEMCRQVRSASNIEELQRIFIRRDINEHLVKDKPDSADLENLMRSFGVHSRQISCNTLAEASKRLGSGLGLLFETARSRLREIESSSGI